jgi:hypothetical protein
MEPRAKLWRGRELPHKPAYAVTLPSSDSSIVSWLQSEDNSVQIKH